METSLHRQLKVHYAGEGAELEVVLGRYRIDVVVGQQLIEIQHGSLSAIRDKVRDLLQEREVLVVKPIVAAKTLVKLQRKGGKVLQRRRSPKKGCLLDLFNELVYFTKTFPHPRLTLEIVLVDVEEHRYPRARPSRRGKKYQVQDLKLLGVRQTHRLCTPHDLLALLPPDLPPTFNTAQLAEALGVKQWMAQRIAYCLRHTGAARQVGKQGNLLLYQLRRAA